MKIEFKYEFGSVVLHTVSGAKGSVTGVSLCEHGLPMYLVQPKCDDSGAFQQPTWMSEGELELAK